MAFSSEVAPAHVKNRRSAPANMRQMTKLEPIPRRTGKPPTRQSAASAMERRFRASGLGRRRARSVVAARRPDRAASPAETNQGSSASTASRVNGRVPPKITKPRRPSVSRDKGGRTERSAPA